MHLELGIVVSILETKFTALGNEERVRISPESGVWAPSGRRQVLIIDEGI